LPQRLAKASMWFFLLVPLFFLPLPGDFRPLERASSDLLALDRRIQLELIARSSLFILLIPSSGQARDSPPPFLRERRG